MIVRARSIAARTRVSIAEDHAAVVRSNDVGIVHSDCIDSATSAGYRNRVFRLTTYGSTNDARPYVSHVRQFVITHSYK